MWTKTNKITHCNGCDFHCTLGAQRKLFSFPAKYYPTVNSKKITEYTDINGKTKDAITKTKAHAIARAKIHVQHCANYQHTK